MKRSHYRTPELTKRTFTFLISGVVMTLVILLFLMACQWPCTENQYAVDYETHRGKRNLLSPSKYSRYKLVIFILSAPDNFNERNVIRETWTSGVDESLVLYRFVVGTAALEHYKSSRLEQENKLCKDMLLMNNVKDSYEKLSFKVLQAFAWLDRNVNYQYVLKVDDDSFVRVPAVLVELDHKPKERLYWGFFDGRANVKTSGKWKESKWILCDKYLPYARGGGYVLSFDLVHFISRNGDLLQLYLSEDVSVGTWLAPLKVNRHHDQNFDTEYMSRGCLNTYLVMHKQSTVGIRELHYNLESRGVLCKNEVVLRGSYEYNWSYPPSQCCNRSNIRSMVNSKN